MTGKLIVFEGIDGCGKGTQLKLAEDYFSNNGYNIFVAREPGGVKVSEKIREILLNPEYKEMIPVTELLLYEAARAQVVEETLRPNLRKRDLIFFDRFYHATFAYQGYGRRLDKSLINYLNNITTQGIIPDLTLVFDVPLDVALERMGKTDLDRMEDQSREFHKRVREGYLHLKHLLPNENIKVINGNRLVEDVFEETKKNIERILSNKI